MKWRLGFVVLLFAYLFLILPFTTQLKTRPVEVKLGYMPHPQLLKVISGEHAASISELLTLKVLFYFGTLLQKFQENVIIRPEFYNMFKILQGAIHLDPYNMDAYYFAQASFTWELGRIEEVNHLLEIGLEKRTWDYWIPFYLGFNYSYFLKDYQRAAVYMQRAAELSGNPLFAKLAARYFYESEQTAFGLAFLETMIATAQDPAVKRTYELRRDALGATLIIERALKEYQQKYAAPAKTLDLLLEHQILPELPVDPYGGVFYLDEQGRVRSSSQFTDQKP
jgi:tetratricopeptide (TPR) repeat protein